MDKNIGLLEIPGILHGENKDLLELKDKILPNVD